MNRLSTLALALALATGPALAAAPPAQAPLPAWDQLTAAQRDLVIAPLRDRWNADPQMRTRLFQHAQRWQQLTPEEQKSISKDQQRCRQLMSEKQRSR